MLPQFGKAGPTLLLLAATATLALTLTARTTPKKPHIAWLFDPSSARSYDALGDVDTELLPSRLLAVRVMAAALAKLPCAADVVELESGSSRRGLQRIPRDLEASLTPDLPESRLEVWRDGPRLMAIPRDINPVVLAYRADLWESVEKVKTWSDFIDAAQVLESSRPGTRAIELPRSNAAILLLLLQQRGANLQHRFDDPTAAATIAEYVRWIRLGVGTDPARRIEGTAAALDEGRLAAVTVPDWKLGQLRRLMKTPLKLRLLPEGAITPTWGGTGVGIPRYNPDPARLASLISRLTQDHDTQFARFLGDNIVPVSKAARDGHRTEDTRLWWQAADSVLAPPISGEPTAAIQREINAILRWAISSNASQPAIRERLRAADDRLRETFARGGQR